jgi:hypothetical protein
VTGFYAGWFLAHYCPAEGVRNTGQMWLWYALIAMASPLLLFLTRHWLRGGAPGRGNTDAQDGQALRSVEAG